LATQLAEARARCEELRQRSAAAEDEWEVERRLFQDQVDALSAKAAAAETARGAAESEAAVRIDALREELQEVRA
jgi:hypothetical protein